jgi:hypothetical protein
MSGSLWIALSLLLGILILEITYPAKVLEGFRSAFSDLKEQAPTVRETPNMLIAPFEKRGDIGPRSEEGGYANDKRYFADWMDVQRLGERRDYCRMVYPDMSGAVAKEEESFFACALAGTSGLTSISYRTKTVKEGFKRSRDDYINRIRQDGRDAYCRILKQQDGTYAPTCLPADDKSFGTKDFLDADPPDEIKTLVDFFRGCRLWLRFRDDMLDYIIGKTIIQTAGNPTMLAIPNPPVTRGLQLNGKDQYIRFGDTSDLSFGNEGSLRSVRAFSVWVKFKEFTNNAHIFDFGNGAGKDNVFLGILGKGDAELKSGNKVRDDNSKCKDTTIPDGKSGAQWCPEMRADELFSFSRSNVDEYTCEGPETEPDGKKAEPIETTPLYVEDPNAPRRRATLLYEVWDGGIRKMQIKVNRVIPLDEWVHIVITAKNMDALRPDIQVHVNGTEVYTLESGFLPQTAVTSHNYIGKSNWTDASGDYELRDELLNGAIFDLRIYNAALSESRIKRMLQWGMNKLGLTA